MATNCRFHSFRSPFKCKFHTNQWLSWALMAEDTSNNSEVINFIDNSRILGVFFLENIRLDTTLTSALYNLIFVRLITKLIECNKFLLFLCSIWKQVFFKYSLWSDSILNDIFIAGSQIEMGLVGYETVFHNSSFPLLSRITFLRWERAFLRV